MYGPMMGQASSPAIAVTVIQAKAVTRQARPSV